MSTMPSGLRYSERKLYETCPEARPVLERMSRMRADRRVGRGNRVVALIAFAAFMLTLPLAILHPLGQGVLGMPHWFVTGSDLVIGVCLWRSGRRA